MGTFSWQLRISGMDRQLSRDIEAVVDTGAAYTTLPTRLLRDLGIAPMGKRRFLLADGRRIEMDYGQGVGYDRRRQCRYTCDLWRRRCPSPAGGPTPWKAWALAVDSGGNSDWSRLTSSCTRIGSASSLPSAARASVTRPLPQPSVPTRLGKSPGRRARTLLPRPLKRDERSPALTRPRP